MGVRPANGGGPGAPPSSRRDRWLGAGFGWLARSIVAHPRVPILVGVAVLLVSLPAAANVGAVISNNFGNVIPSSDASVVAQTEYDHQFPNSTAPPSSALVLLEAPQITGPTGRNATLAVASALDSDPALHNVSSVTSLYSAYASYLTGQAELGLAFLHPAVAPPAGPNLTDAVRLTAAGVWQPVDGYVTAWTQIDRGLPNGTPPSAANWPAYNQTRASLGNASFPLAILDLFYYGDGASYPGFNQSVTPGCLTSGNVSPCAVVALRSTVTPAIPTLASDPTNRTLLGAVVDGLSIDNYTSPPAIQRTAASVLGAEVGLDPVWLLTLWQAFPSGAAPPPAIAAWARSLVATTSPGGYPLPIPAAMERTFVNAGGTATLLFVAFNVSDGAEVNGTSITYADVQEIGHAVGRALDASPAFRGVAHYETGDAALTGATNYLATSALSLLLVLTIVVLVGIMIVYFRAPAAPLVSFGAIGLALAISLAIMFVIGTFVTQFNPEVEPVVLVFLMSIGTDYTVFLMARYREELVRGTPHKEAVETTVRWAGQSITTSGATVLIVTIALTFSGIGPLSQFGFGLTFSVVVAVLVALTVVPAILMIVGPRIFWPYTGSRFRAFAQRRRASVDADRGYMTRAGRTATLRPKAVIAVIVLVSVPVVVLALQVPTSYDITNIGLPASNPAQAGFIQLNEQFGPGYVSTSFVLATFASPLLHVNQTNATEFRDLGGLTDLIAATPGVASVSSPLGPDGAPLGAWLNFSTAPPAQRILLGGVLGSFVGIDGRTVALALTTNESGFSAPAVTVLADLRERVGGFQAAHPELAQVRYGGAAPTTEDLRALVDRANEGMLIGAALGLFLVLFLILGSAFVPALALGAIGLSILWGWFSTYVVLGLVEHVTLTFLLPLILLIMVLGLGMDYNVLLLTRVREERGRPGGPIAAIQRAVSNAGGVIVAAAVILGGAFLLLGLTSPLGLLAGIGLGIGIAVLLQAFVVQTYLTPAVLAIGKDRIWGQRPPPPPDR